MKCLLFALLWGFGAAALDAKDKPPTAYTIPLPPKPDFSAFDWLMGEWTGKTTGRSPQAEVRLSVAFALEKRFVILQEEVSFAATKAAPASRESWMGILSANPSNTGFLLRTFSSNGFITRYQVTVEGPEIHLNPEGGEQPPPGWLFRRIVRRSGVAELNEMVQAAPPDKPFFDYYSAKLTRKPAP